MGQTRGGRVSFAQRCNPDNNPTGCPDGFTCNQLTKLCDDVRHINGDTIDLDPNRSRGWGSRLWQCIGWGGSMKRISNHNKSKRKTKKKRKKTKRRKKTVKKSKRRNR